MPTTLRTSAAALVLFAASAAQASDSTTLSTHSYDLPHCDRPVASVLVGQVSCKAAACNTAQGNNPMSALVALASGQPPNFAHIGAGMAAMLTTALKESGCFEIQERETLDEVAKELALVGKTVEVQQADFMISGTITSIEMQTEKKEIGGGLLRMVPVVRLVAGGLSSTTSKAALGFDVKIIDINRAKLVESKTLEANNTTSSYSLGAGGVFGGGALAGGLSSVAGTPLEPIMRDVLSQAAAFAANRLVKMRQP